MTTTTLSDPQGRAPAGSAGSRCRCVSCWRLLDGAASASRRAAHPPPSLVLRGLARRPLRPSAPSASRRPGDSSPVAGTASDAVEDSPPQEPPPAAGEEVPRPLQHEPSAEEARQTQRSALDLIDRSLARFEAERARAGQAQSPRKPAAMRCGSRDSRQRRAALRAQLEAP